MEGITPNLPTFHFPSAALPSLSLFPPFPSSLFFRPSNFLCLVNLIQKVGYFIFTQKKVIVPFPLLLFCLERFNLPEQCVFHCIMPLINCIKRCYRKLPCPIAGVTPGIDLSSGGQSNIEKVEILLQRTSTVSFSDIS